MDDFAAQSLLPSLWTPPENAPAPTPAEAPAPAAAAPNAMVGAPSDRPVDGIWGAAGGRTTEGADKPKDGADQPKALAADTIHELANSIFKARDGLGTDDKAINSALRQCKSQEDIEALKKEYSAAHGGRSLDDDIKDPEAKALMSPEDPAARQTAAVLALKDAKSLLGSTDPEKVHAALEHLSPDERKAAMAAYEKETGSSLQDQSKDTSVATAAAKGAMIGSIIPGVGTVLGGIVGGIVGAMSGSKSADEDNSAIDKIVSGDEVGYRKEVIEKELHGGLFGSGGILGLGIGRDTDKIDRTIENADPKDVAKLKDAVGKDVATTLTGDDQKLATALLDGDKGKAAAEAVRIHQSDGIFSNDKEKVFSQMEGKSPAEREAMKKQFKEQYGQDVDSFMESELGKDSNELKAARQLENSKDAKAKMDPAFELKYAMDGAGTDMKRMKDALAGKSPEEIAKIKDDYQKLTGKSLEEDMAGESKLKSTSLLTGEVSDSRDGLELKQMLRGDPERISDPVARAKAKLLSSNEDYEFERGSGRGFLDKAVDAASFGHVKSITDAYSDAGTLMDEHHAEMSKIGDKLKNGEQLSPTELKRFESLAGYHKDDRDDFRAAKDTVTNGAAVAGTVVVGALVAVATEGAATPAVVAAVSALTGGAAGMMIKSGMQGQGYSNDQIATDAAMTLVQAGTAGFAQSASFAKVLAAVPGGAAILQNPMLLEAAKMAMMNGTGAAAGALMDQENWRNGRVLESMVTKGAAGMASGAVTGGLMGGAGAITSNRAIAGVLGGAMGGLAQTALDPAAWDGDAKKLLIQNLGTNVGGALIAGMAGSHQAAAPHEQAPVAAPHPTLVEPAVVAPHPTLVEPPAAPATLRSPEMTHVPESARPTVRMPEPIAEPEPATVPRPITPAEPAPATLRSPELPYVPESSIPTQRIPEPEPFPQTQRTGEPPAKAAPAAPASVELPPVDDGHNWGERAFTPAEREALAKMDPERFGHMVEEPASSSATTEKKPAALPVEEPAAPVREKDAMRLEGEEEYLRRENEAAEAARAARSAGEEPAPVTQNSPVGPEPTPRPAPKVEVIESPASPADTERAPAVKVPREEHYWGPAMPEGEPGFAPESATPSQEAATQMPATEMPATEMPPTEMAPTERAAPKLDEEAPGWWGKQQKTSQKAMSQLPELPEGTLEKYGSREIGKAIVDRVAAMRENVAIPGTPENGISGPELRKKAELCMFFKDAMFEKIQENGFLNSHEVGSSGGGITDNEGRAQQESRLAGMRLGNEYEGGRTALNEVRPKYAILNVGLDENLGSPTQRANTEAYGNVQAVMGDHMFERSTFTQGDTYGGADLENTLPQTFKDAHTKLKMDGGYFEGQMWGKVTTDDVAEYRVRPGTDPEVVKKLAATGKPVYELHTDESTGREIYGRGKRLDAPEASASPSGSAEAAVEKPAAAPQPAGESPSHIAVTNDGDAVHPTPEADAKVAATAPAAPETARAPREVNAEVMDTHGKEIERLRAENADAIEYAYDDKAKSRAEQTRGILDDIDKVADPKIAGRVLEELGRIDAEPDGPAVDLHQKLLRGVVGIEDPQLSQAAMEAVGRRDLDPKRRAALADAMADTSSPEGLAKLRDAVRRSLGGDGEAIHTVRPIEDVPKTPAIGEHLGDAMKDFPYTSEQTEVSHDIVNKYREMLRAGLPLEPCNVVNGQHLIDGHHRAIAQMLELGELVYVTHSEVPGFAQGGKSVDWGDVHLQPTWGPDHINGAPLVDAEGQPLVKAATPEPAAKQPAEENTAPMAGRKELLERARNGEKVRIEMPGAGARGPAEAPAAPRVELPELSPEQQAELDRRNALAYANAIDMRGTFEGDTLGKPGEPYPRSAMIEALTSTTGNASLVEKISQLIKADVPAEELFKHLGDHQDEISGPPSR